ncbi:leucine-rich repeat domain-containing protein [Pseudomonas aegrilactucae]|uniref:Leucine-rich repeat domain-containing protein n=1 Tax=Pseudomonas aegrilactucae TaxID=2854028 RepID=A0A9Q2XH02_9PSED|nr:leucine-rich repeat domain-containing protein [Pseudomonas aegrilactucae]MBV6286763.1 leucine-rich repeat domain-containing protein [Pseudomonas aegrilactucae]
MTTSTDTYVTPGPHGPFIHQRLPDWLKHSTPESFAALSRPWGAEQHQGGADVPARWFSSARDDQRQALLAYQQRSQASAAVLARTLTPLRGIVEFAEPLLKARLKRELQCDDEVNTHEFVHVTHDTELLGALVRVVPRRQSLLQAALQNFAKDAEFDAGTALAAKGAFSMELVPGSEKAPRYRYVYSSKLQVSPGDFARVCHELDLGQQYQDHLAAVYEAPATREAVRRHSIAAYKDRLRVHTQLAVIKGEVGDAARSALLGWLDGVDVPLYHGKPLVFSTLEMFGIGLSDIWVASADRLLSEQTEPVLVYVPGAPLYPLKEYPSIEAFKHDLRVNLISPTYQQALRGCVARADQERFFRLLESNLFHLADSASGLLERQPNLDADLHLREHRVNEDLFALLHRRLIEKAKADARHLAVPSADADEAAREARLAYWESIGMNVLNTAAFFVPGLGEVMAVVAAHQLVGEVIEGIEDWKVGDRELAMAHLQSVALNIAFAVGLGLVLKPGAVGPGSELLEGTIQIKLANGHYRLWKPDLEPYAVDVDLSGITPDTQGRYSVAGKTYIRVQGRAHELVSTEAGLYQLRHPRGGEAYQPQVVHNGAGAWRLEAEDPLQWQGLTLWRRLGHLVDGMGDEELLQMAAITGVDDARLRRLHSNNEPLPALLGDSLVRWQMSRKVVDVIGAMREGQPLAAGLDALPLALLTRMNAWPNGLLVRVMEDGQLLKEYGTPLHADNRTLSITRQELADGRFLNTLLQGLTEQEEKALFGPYLAKSDAGRLKQLREVYANYANANRSQVFDSLYRADPIEQVAGIAVLRRQFAGLAWRQARELVESASVSEHAQLLATPPRVALRLVEQARWLVEQARVVRAREGLYLGYTGRLDSLKVALDQLQALPGWSGEVGLHVRDGSPWGEALKITSDNKAIGTRRILVRLDEGYQAYDSEHNVLGGVETLCAALLHALPDSERVLLGLDIDQAEALRLMLAENAAKDPAAVRRSLGVRPRTRWFKPPLRMPDGEIGYPLSGRRPFGRPQTPLQRARSLFPDLSAEQAQRFLQELGEGLSEEELLVRLETRRQELYRLIDDLGRWRNDQAASAEARIQREVAADRIERCWRRQTSEVVTAEGRVVGYSLDLSGAVVEGLPALSADFSHVASLLMRDMALAELPEPFIELFDNIRWLNLSNNRFSSLPARLGNMPRLTRLMLSHNQVVIDAAANATLAGLVRLRMLSLDHNPLGVAPDVSPLADLRILRLQHSGISGWPNGLMDLPYLVEVDLRANNIEVVGQEVLAPDVERAERVLRINRVTHLHGNPINADSQVRLTVYRQRTRISFGVTPNLRVHFAPEPMTAGATAWLRGG